MAVVLYHGLELLDVGAPCEVLGAVPQQVELLYCAQGGPGPVRTSCMELAGGSEGPRLHFTHTLAEGGLVVDGRGGAPFRPDAIMLPGGKGMRAEVKNQWLLTWLREAAEQSDVILTVCTGSWLLAATGALDGAPATSNKNALRNGHPQAAAPNVQWKTHARWVEHEIARPDGRRTLAITSSGVSAGGDAALALIARLGGLDMARRVAHRAEWSWHEDSTSDPFAEEFSAKLAGA